jgi:hypothetical protein
MINDVAFVTLSSHSFNRHVNLSKAKKQHASQFQHRVKEKLAVLTQQHPLICIAHIFTGDDAEDDMDEV